LLLLQAGSTPPATLPKLAIPAAACPAVSSADQVVVCGSRGGRSRYRLPEISTEYDRQPVAAEKQLAPGVTGKVAVESAELAGGHKSDRVMVRLTFGR
jgi:hypothetical protein